MKCRHCNGTGVEQDWRAVGAAVRTLRRKAGLTLTELAGLTGTTQGYLSDLELGRRAWSGPKAQRVLGHLGMRGSHV